MSTQGPVHSLATSAPGLGSRPGVRPGTGLWRVRLGVKAQQQEVLVLIWSCRPNLGGPCSHPKEDQREHGGPAYSPLSPQPILALRALRHSADPPTVGSLLLLTPKSPWLGRGKQPVWALEGPGIPSGNVARPSVRRTPASFSLPTPSAALLKWQHVSRSYYYYYYYLH